MKHQSKHAAASAAPRGRRLARPAQAAEYLQVSRSTLYAWQRERTGFPQAVQVGPRAVAFDLDEIDAFLAKQGGKA